MKGGNYIRTTFIIKYKIIVVLKMQYVVMINVTGRRRLYCVVDDVATKSVIMAMTTVVATLVTRRWRCENLGNYLIFAIEMVETIRNW